MNVEYSVLPSSKREGNQVRRLYLAGKEVLPKTFWRLVQGEDTLKTQSCTALPSKEKLVGLVTI